MLLAADIGGTKTNLAFFEADGPRLRTVAEATYHSHDHQGPQEMLRAFLAAHPHAVERICLGIAGPVSQGRVATPNLPWVVEAAPLAAAFGCPVTLLNDLEANAHGLRVLGPGDFAVLNPGAPGATGNAALIAAGTGLGEAGLYWDGTRHRPFASEGGHADFAPRSPLEAEVRAHLARQEEHVSYERVLSGPGLHNLYAFLRERAGADDELPALMAELGVTDPPAAISQAALAGRSRLCEEALEVFVSVYGAEAGNLALKMLATGGVFLGGGIAPKILPKLQEPAFLRAFVAKGRMRPLLEAIPVRVVLNPKAALLGAARHAADLLAGTGDGPLPPGHAPA
jgi:glucokinase